MAVCVYKIRQGMPIMPSDEKIADMTWFKLRSATAAPHKGSSRPRRHHLTWLGDGIVRRKKATLCSQGLFYSVDLSQIVLM